MLKTRTLFLFIILTFSLTAFISGPTTEPEEKEPIPYRFLLPRNLLPVISPGDNPTTEEGVALGRKLFYDPVLSGNQKQSCSSCHKQSLAFTDGLDISTGSNQKKARRNSMALVNLGWQDGYFWDGRALNLEALIHFPVTDTMEMNADTLVIARRLNADENYKVLFTAAFGKKDITMNMVAKAISQFLRTIVSYNAPFDRIFRDYLYNGGEIQNTKSNMNDLRLMLNALGPGNETMYGHDSLLTQTIKQVSPDAKVLTAFSRCLVCHYNSLQIFCLQCKGTIPPEARVQYKNNGLEVEGKDKGRYQQTGREEDKYLFKVPTFRNLSLTGPYMHDGRFKTLEEVIDHYNTGIQANPNLDTLLKQNNAPIRFNLNGEEKKELLGILKLFSDSSVVTDARFSKPGKLR